VECFYLRDVFVEFLCKVLNLKTNLKAGIQAAEFWTVNRESVN
jgi:hypothetical protein